MPQDIVKNNRTISQQLEEAGSGCDTIRGRQFNRSGKQRDQLKPLSSQGTCVYYRRLHSLTLHPVRKQISLKCPAKDKRVNKHQQPQRALEGQISIQR